MFGRKSKQKKKGDKVDVGLVKAAPSKKPTIHKVPKENQRKPSSDGKSTSVTKPKQTAPVKSGGATAMGGVSGRIRGLEANEASNKRVNGIFW